MINDGVNCFGFYSGGPVCIGCAINKRCKAVLISNGFDVVGALINQLTATLPEEGSYLDTDLISKMTDQLLEKPELKQEEDDLLVLLKSKGIESIDAEDL